MVLIQGRNQHGNVLGGRFKNIQAARRFAQRNNLVSWAIYDEAAGFHSTTQQEHLIMHHRDEYWTAQGVAGV